MANHTRAWNDAYEDLPPNTGENASIGASRIRDLKDDVRERMVVDHGWKDGLTTGSEDGEHTKVTLEQRANPSNLVDKIIIFGKDVDGKCELHAIDEDGNVIQLTFKGQVLTKLSPNSQSGNYTLVIGDVVKFILHPSGGGAGDTFTIPANASVAFPVGTLLTFVNEDSNNLSVAITTDTMTLAGTTSTGTRTVGQNGILQALKTSATTWLCDGAAVS